MAPIPLTTFFYLIPIFDFLDIDILTLLKKVNYI